MFLLGFSESKPQFLRDYHLKNKILYLPNINHTKVYEINDEPYKNYFSKLFQTKN